MALVNIDKATTKGVDVVHTMVAEEEADSTRMVEEGVAEAMTKEVEEVDMETTMKVEEIDLAEVAVEEEVVEAEAGVSTRTAVGDHMVADGTAEEVITMVVAAGVAISKHYCTTLKATAFSFVVNEDFKPQLHHYK